MKTLLDKIQSAAITAKNNTRINDSMQDRKDYLLTLLDIEIERSQVVICENEKPCTGRAFGITDLSDRYRVNYRCGYSRHNYAPCIEILK